MYISYTCCTICGTRSAYMSSTRGGDGCTYLRGKDCGMWGRGCLHSNWWRVAGMYLSLSCARAIADVAALARDRPSMPLR